MIHPELLAGGFERNTWVLHQQIDGLTHEESLLQLPFRGNCLNWVVGHIVENRNRVLALVNLPPLWTEERYKTGADPITEDSQALRFEALMDYLDRSSTQVGEGIRQLALEDIEKVVTDNGRTLGQGLLGLYWHETYHIGQTELLRQLAGKNDAIF